MKKKIGNWIKAILVCVLSGIFSGIDQAYSQKEKISDWSFLSTTTIGAKQFIQSHPEFDGRGIVIFILDSGVDMGVSGLLRTSEGQVKVIDVRDFSGQGDVSLYSGEIGEENQEKFIGHPDGFRLYNYHRLNELPVDHQYLIGYLDEKRFLNSDLNDINNNRREDDKFGILVFEAGIGDSASWVAYIDTDGDQHIDDEQAIRDYGVSFDTIQLRGGDKNYDRRLLTFAINIVPDDMKISFHFDDSGHGTHVAGIAAGFKINNQERLNGIAPGAQIISLKIGNGTYEGGCTVTGSLKKALNFADNYARKYKKPIVINISYGIGSIREGQSDIDHIVSNLLTFNDDVFVTVSNGNDGPGISTTGTPAAAPTAFSVGAMLPVQVSNDCYGTNLKQDKIFYFSARGGELNKPDAIAPGFASSTIPNFSDNDFMRGTSMAAPQAAGAAALLLSAALQSQPQLSIKNTFIHRALKYSSNPISGYSYLDQGNGLINVPQAYKFLQIYTKNYQNDNVHEYEITTACPSHIDDQCTSAYWRTGGYYPTSGEKQTFTINPIFNDSVDADNRATFYRAFDLKSSEHWLYPLNKSIYIKGEKPAMIDVKYNPEFLTKPGLYCGKIIGYRKQESLPKFDPTAIEFELLNTIIIPHIFDYNNKYHQEFSNRVIDPGDVNRYFILVPTGATTAKVIIAPSKNNFCNVTAFGYTPEGFDYFTTSPITSKEQNQEIQVIPSSKLTPGIWEIDVYADFQNEEASIYDLSISFSSFQIEPPLVSDFNYQAGQEPKGYLKITNQFNIPFYGFGRGKVLGYQRSQEKIIRDRDKFSYDFKIGSEVKMVEFELDFEDNSFLKFTDVAVNVYDPQFRTIFKDALNQDQSRIVLDQVIEGTYTLEIVTAFAYFLDDESWTFNFTEKYYVKDPIDIKIFQGVDRLFKLYPFIAKEFEFTLNSSPRIPPDGFNIFGTIEFTDRNLLQQVFTVPVEFR